MSRFLLIAALWGLPLLSAFAQSDCPNPYDGNNDGAVTVVDLLGLLLYFGDLDVDEDGIWDSADDCIDETACNFGQVPTAPCAYIDVLGECGGGCEADQDDDGICDDEDPCVGELDVCGECNGQGDIYECGCFDIPQGDCDCGGNQLDALGECGGDCAEDADDDGVCDDVDDCVGAYDTCGICNGPGEIYECGCFDIPEGDCDCNGNQLDAVGFCGGTCEADLDGDGICDIVDDCIGMLDACGVCNGPGAVYECGCADLLVGDCDCNGSQLDAVGECGGMCAQDLDADGICDDEDSCVGQIDACGLCNGPGDIYECGCEDIPAGDCDCGGNQLDVLGVCGGECLADTDMDGICDDVDVCIGASLDALGVCGGTCLADSDADGVCDDEDECVDAAACNFSSASNEPCQYTDVLGICGGGCEGDMDEDGICDDVDTCMGLLDECGVCNGPGPTELYVEDIVILYDSTYQEELDAWEVFPSGIDTVFGYTCAPIFGSCGDPLIYQGYEYATVEIGGQCWFAENLRSEQYANSEAILSELDATSWSSVSEGAMATYGEATDCNHDAPGFDACDPTLSLPAYGRLYNWYAVTDPRGLCPNGWHVPTDEEWSAVVDLWGGSAEAGVALKSTQGWFEGGNGTNASGLNGVPGGVRFNNGNFNFAGSYSSWWSSSPNGDFAWGRFLYHDNEGVIRDYYGPSFGFSVRCVEDNE